MITWCLPRISRMSTSTHSALAQWPLLSQALYFRCDILRPAMALTCEGSDTDGVRKKGKTLLHYFPNVSTISFRCPAAVPRRERVS